MMERHLRVNLNASRSKLIEKRNLNGWDINNDRVIPS